MTTPDRPHYDRGVAAPCDRCGEGDVLIATAHDYMDEVTEMSCRACVEGWDDGESPQDVTYQEAILEGADPTEGFYA